MLLTLSIPKSMKNNLRIALSLFLENLVRAIRGVVSIISLGCHTTFIKVIKLTLTTTSATTQIYKYLKLFQLTTVFPFV